MITLNQARSHLAGLRHLAVAENIHLSCVRSYLRDVEVDVIGLVKADSVKDYKQLVDLYDDVAKTRQHIDLFMRGDL